MWIYLIPIYLVPHDISSILEAAKSCMHRYQRVGFTISRLVPETAELHSPLLEWNGSIYATENIFLSHHQLYPLFAAITVTDYVANSSKHGDNHFHQKNLDPR